MSRQRAAIGTTMVALVIVVVVAAAAIGYVVLTKSTEPPTPSCGSGNCLTSSGQSTIFATAQTTLDGFNLTVIVVNTMPHLGDVIPIQIVLTDVSNSTAYPDGCSVDLITVKNQTGATVYGLGYAVSTGTGTHSTSVNGIGQNKIINQSWNVTSQQGFAPVVAGIYFIDVSQCFTNNSGSVTVISAKPIQVEVGQ